MRIAGWIMFGKTPSTREMRDRNSIITMSPRRLAYVIQAALACNCPICPIPAKNRKAVPDTSESAKETRGSLPKNVKICAKSARMKTAQ